LKSKRNNLFHTGGLSVPEMTDEEKNEIRRIAKKSIDIMNRLSELLNQRQGERRGYLP
jgi:hypothetical protein